MTLNIINNLIIMKHKIAILPGDGIGPEIIAEAEKVLSCLETDFGLKVEREYAPVGGQATRRPAILCPRRRWN